MRQDCGLPSCPISISATNKCQHMAGSSGRYGGIEPIVLKGYSTAERAWTAIQLLTGTSDHPRLPRQRIKSLHLGRCRWCQVSSVIKDARWIVHDSVQSSVRVYTADLPGSYRDSLQLFAQPIHRSRRVQPSIQLTRTEQPSPSRCTPRRRA